MRPGRRFTRLAGCLALAGAGVLGAVAAAPGFGALGLPTLPTVTVPTPITTVTVSLPTPPPPPPVTVPPVTPPPPPPPSPPPPPAAAPAAGRSGTAAPSGHRTAARGARTHRANAPLAIRKHKAVTLVFRLRRAGPVRFVVRRSGCDFVSSFTVHGHAGVNRVRFAGRIHGHRLPGGTYRIRAHSRGKTVLRAKLVVLGGAPMSCARSIPAIARLAGLSFASGSSAGPGSTPGAKPALAESKTALPPNTDKLAAPHRSGVLGARAAKILPGSGGTQFVLLIVLTCAIFLLALGAVPRRVVPHPGAAALLARHRAAVAAGGLAALTAFLVSYFLI